MDALLTLENVRQKGNLALQHKSPQAGSQPHSQPRPPRQEHDLPYDVDPQYISIISPGALNSKVGASPYLSTRTSRIRAFFVGLAKEEGETKTLNPRHDPTPME